MTNCRCSLGSSSSPTYTHRFLAYYLLLHFIFTFFFDFLLTFWLLFIGIGNEAFFFFCLNFSKCHFAVISWIIRLQLRSYNRILKLCFSLQLLGLLRLRLRLCFVNILLNAFFHFAGLAQSLLLLLFLFCLAQSPTCCFCLGNDGICLLLSKYSWAPDLRQCSAAQWSIMQNLGK